MPDAGQKIDDLRRKRNQTKQDAAAKRADAKQKAKQATAKTLKALKAAERDQVEAIDRRIRRAEARLRGQARRDDTRCKVLVGAAVIAEVQTIPQRKRRLYDLLDKRLTRTDDRALCARLLDLPDLAAPAASRAPLVSPEDPIPGWHPFKLPDGSWRARFEGDTSKLPDELIGCHIVATRSSGNWIATVLEAVERSSRHALVRCTAPPSPENPRFRGG